MTNAAYQGIVMGTILAAVALSVYSLWTALH
jgi:hypothetical protein